MAEIWDADRRIAVCRELTKLYEEVKRGTAAELVPWAEEGVRGEIVIVVEGLPPLWSTRPGRRRWSLSSWRAGCV